MTYYVTGTPVVARPTLPTCQQCAFNCKTTRQVRDVNVKLLYVFQTIFSFIYKDSVLIFMKIRPFFDIKILIIG